MHRVVNKLIYLDANLPVSAGTEGVFADLELRKKELLGMKTTWA